MAVPSRSMMQPVLKELDVSLSRYDRPKGGQEAARALTTMLADAARTFVIVRQRQVYASAAHRYGFSSGGHKLALHLRMVAELAAQGRLPDVAYTIEMAAGARAQKKCEHGKSCGCVPQLLIAKRGGHARCARRAMGGCYCRKAADHFGQRGQRERPAAPGGKCLV